MKRIQSIIITVVLLVLSCNYLIAQINLPDNFEYQQKVEELKEKQLIDLLSGDDQNLRISAAQQITNLLNKGLNRIAKDNIIEHKIDHWESKSLASVYKRYSRIEDGKIRINYTSLDKFLKAFGLKKEAIKYATYKNYTDYQLDHLFKIRFRNIANKVDLISVSESPIHFSVSPHESYSGDWLNFYIVGKIYSRASYSNGSKIQEEIYDYQENLQYRKYYVNDICYRIEFYNIKGEISKVHYELLTEDETSIICSKYFVYQ